VTTDKLSIYVANTSDVVFGFDLKLHTITSACGFPQAQTPTSCVL